MIRAIRINSMCLNDHQGLLTGWNISPDKAWTLILSPSASACGVVLLLDGLVMASGAALVGVKQPCVLVPSAGVDLEMLDPDLGWHVLITTTGTEEPLSIDMDPVVDLPDVIHPIYQADNLAQVRATADIDAATHYVDEISVTCPKGLGAGLGDVVQLDTDDTVAGQVESLVFTGTPDGWDDTAMVRQYLPMGAIPIEQPPAPPVVVDDTAETEADTAISGNVLDNDDPGLTVVAVNGLGANIGQPVAGSAGGVFIIQVDGSWEFDPDGDFASLTGSETETTSITYHASNGFAESEGTLTVTVSSGVGDPYWNNVVALLHFDGDLVDKAGGSWSWQGGPSNYVPGKFGSAARLSNSRIQRNSPIYFEGYDFTIEFKINKDSNTQNNWAAVLINRAGASNNAQIYLGPTHANSSDGAAYEWMFQWSTTGTNNPQTRWDLPDLTGAFRHIALCRRDNELFFFVDGSRILAKTKYSDSISGSLYKSTSAFNLGCESNSYPSYIKSAIDELRITKGVARYTSNFTPPTGPFPNF